MFSGKKKGSPRNQARLPKPRRSVSRLEQIRTMRIEKAKIATISIATSLLLYGFTLLERGIF